MYLYIIHSGGLMGDYFLEKCKNLSDNDLISLINDGDYVYLGVIIDRYTPVIGGIISKFSDCGIDRDDLFQEATLALFSAIKTFDSDKASFATFAPICIGRAINDVVRATNAKRRVPERMLTPLDEIVLTDEASPETILIEKENYHRLAANIKLDLSPLEYNVLCAFLADKSYADIASELNITTKSVDNTLRRIRKKLKGK